MQAQITAIDTGPAYAAPQAGARRGGAGSPFEQLMAQLTQNTASGSSDATTGIDQATAATAASSKLGEAQEGGESPIQRLGRALRASGQSLDNCQVASADRDKLEKVLVQSGYRLQDARQAMERASNADGSVNLGALFANLTQYLPINGPMLLLNLEDAPLLTQVLKDLGLDQGKIQQFMDNLPKQGDQLVVQGLPELLAQAEPQQAKGLDQQVLSDLLGRLGLSQEQVQSLLSRATDNQGRTTPSSLLALFNVAAQQQEQGLAGSLQDLAGRLQQAKVSNGKSGGADQLRAKVIQTLQKIEAQVASQTQSLSKQWQQALEQSEAALKGQGAQPGQGQAWGQEGGQGLALGQGMGLPGLIRQVLAGQEALAGAVSQAVQAEATAQAGRLVDGSQAAGQRLAGRPAPASAEGSQGASAPSEGEALDQPQAVQAATPRPVARAQAGSDLGLTTQGQAQAEEAAPAGPSLPAYVVRQVGQQIAQMVTRQENSLRLELKPPSLGEVSLDLTVKDGVVKATLLTDTVAAKQMLEQGLDQLKQQLTMQGLKVEQVQIMVNPDAQRQAAQGQAQAGLGGRGSRPGGGQQDGSDAQADGPESLESLPSPGPAGGGRINLFA